MSQALKPPYEVGGSDIPISRMSGSSCGLFVSIQQRCVESCDGQGSRLGERDMNEGRQSLSGRSLTTQPRDFKANTKESHKEFGG